MSAMDKSCFFGLGNYLQDLESKFGLAIIESFLRLSTLTDASIFLLVDAPDGRRFCGKEHLCNSFVDGSLTYDPTKDAEMRLDSKEAAISAVSRRSTASDHDTPQQRQPQHSQQRQPPQHSQQQPSPQQLQPHQQSMEKQQQSTSSTVGVKRHSSAASLEAINSLSSATKSPRMDTSTNHCLKIESWRDGGDEGGGDEGGGGSGIEGTSFPNASSASSQDKTLHDNASCSDKTGSGPSTSWPSATNDNQPLAVAVKEEIVLDDSDDEGEMNQSGEVFFNLTYDDEETPFPDSSGGGGGVNGSGSVGGLGGGVSDGIGGRILGFLGAQKKTSTNPFSNSPSSSSSSSLAFIPLNSNNILHDDDAFQLPQAGPSYSTVVINSASNTFHHNAHPVDLDELPEVRAHLRAYLDADMKAGAVSSYEQPDALLVKESAGYKIISSLLYDVGKKYGLMSLESEADSLRYFYVCFHEFCSYFPNLTPIFNSKIIVENHQNGEAMTMCVSDARTFKTFMRAKMQRTFGRYSKRHC